MNSTWIENGFIGLIAQMPFGGIVAEDTKLAGYAAILINAFILMWMRKHAHE